MNIIYSPELHEATRAKSIAVRGIALTDEVFEIDSVDVALAGKFEFPGFHICRMSGVFATPILITIKKAPKN